MYYYPPPQPPRKKRTCMVLMITLGVLSSAACSLAVIIVAITGEPLFNSSTQQPRSSNASRSLGHHSTATPTRSRIYRTPLPTRTMVPESERPTWTPQPTPVPITAVVQTTGNFRTVPSTQADIVGKLSVGTNIELLETIVLDEMRWFKANMEGQIGWVSEIVLNLDGVAIDKLDGAHQTPKMFEVMPPVGVWCNGNSDIHVCVNSFRYPTQIGYQ